MALPIRTVFANTRVGLPPPVEAYRKKVRRQKALPLAAQQRLHNGKPAYKRSGIQPACICGSFPKRNHNPNSYVLIFLINMIFFPYNLRRRKYLFS